MRQSKAYIGLTAALAVCLAFACTMLGVRALRTGAPLQPDTEQESFIRWVDFNVPTAALDKAYRAALTAGEEELELDFPGILAYLAATYWGNWSSYKAADVDRLLERVRAGENPADLAEQYRDYPYFLETYRAVLGGMVGDYAIELPDENGELQWVTKYGLKAYCPVAEGFGFSHCDDFGNARSFGYRRRHLGNDLMGTVGTPIVAVESGVIEAMAWNRYGGWRIGIRSFDSRRYYYYAHLRRGKPFQPGLNEGDVVQAGDVIGYLGMTGYSNQEDVNGMTVPHLHFGMQLIFDESQKDGNGEIWIDVYQLVNFLERNRSTVSPQGDGYYQRKYSYIDYDAVGQQGGLLQDRIQDEGAHGDGCAHTGEEPAGSQADAPRQ